MPQFLVYLPMEVEKKVKDIKSLTKISKADIIQIIIIDAFKKDIGELKKLFIEIKNGVSTNS